MASWFPSVVEVIGDTPMVELSRITTGGSGRILAKLEYLSPGSSKKDRIARQIIEDAEASGELRPGQTVVELTSGNTGTGLAVVCAVKAYPFVAVMSKGNSAERARMMRALGAEVVLVDQAPGSVPGQVSGADLELVEQETRRIVGQRGAFRAHQFEHPGAYRAHYLPTGPEFWRQSGGCLDLFCDFVGSGTTFAGCATFLKEQNPAIRCFLVEPEGACAVAGEPATHPSHRIQGGGYSMPVLPLLNPALIDGFIAVSDEDAIACSRRLAREEGIFAGFSSGANLAAALRLLRDYPGRTVGIVMCDSGLKYLSTDLWE